MQVERQITNQTYILRLHVTTQMAQLLFPPRAELEAAHQAATALDPPPPSSSRLGGGSTYIQLFKQRLTVVDEGNRAWPVQVRAVPRRRAYTTPHPADAHRTSPPPIFASGALLGACSNLLTLKRAAPCFSCPAAAAQYEGFLSSGQRHYRLTSGWVGLMRAQQVGIGG